jgi:hypothetical protein
MIMSMSLRRGFGVVACAAFALLATGCASEPWQENNAVTSGAWQTTPAAGASRDVVTPRNEMKVPPGGRPTTRATAGGAMRPAAGTPTGTVIVGSEASRAGAVGSVAHMDIQCGKGKGGGRCTVVVEVSTPALLDNEHLQLKLEKIGASGNPVRSSTPMTRNAGTIQGETQEYELSVKPCGRVRLSAIPVEAPRGREGVQSRWHVRIIRYRCH